MTMKNSFLLIILTCSSGFLLGQSKFGVFIDNGKAAKDSLEFIKAINYFEAAVLQAENEADKKNAIDWLDSTYVAMEKVRKDIQDLNQDLKQQYSEIRTQSLKNSLIAESSRLALSARLEIEKDSFLNAVRLAQCATEIIKDSTLTDSIHLPFIERTYGDAVYYKYRKKFFPFRTVEGFYDIEYSKSGKYSLAISADSIFFTSSTQVYFPPIISQDYPFRSAHFSPNEELVAVTTQYKNFQVWKIKDTTTVVFEGHEAPLNEAIFSPNGELILSYDRAGIAKLWDLKGNVLSTFSGHTKNIVEAKFSKDGTKILTRAADLSVKLWDLKGHLLKEFNEHKGWLYSACLSSLNDLVVTSSVEKFARLWKVESDESPIKLAHKDIVTQAFFSNTGEKILTLSIDGVAKLWNLEGRLLKTLDGHEGAVAHATFSPNDRYLITASENHGIKSNSLKDHNVRIWDLQSNTNNATVLSAHTKAIISIAFPENNNSMFLTASRDGTSKLWNMNGELLMNLIGELDAPVNKAVFSPNGKFIMIASNLSYLIYSPTPQFVKSILKRKSLRSFTEEEKIFFNAPNCN